MIFSASSLLIQMKDGQMLLIDGELTLPDLGQFNPLLFFMRFFQDNL